MNKLLIAFLLVLSACGDAQSPYGYGIRTIQPLSKEITLSIIKPNAVEDSRIGAIIQRLEDKGLKIAGIQMVKLSKEDAGKFYAVHKDRPFFNDLVAFMTSSPVVILALEGENAVLVNREVMGATDPSQALPGTIRADFAESIQRNAVHGSDSKENGLREVAFFFSQDELYERY